LCWLKVICCICQSNKVEREIQHQTGGQAGGQPKIWGAMAHPGSPLEPPLGNTRTKHNQLCAIIWNFCDAKKLLQDSELTAKVRSMPAAYSADASKAFYEVCNNAIIAKYCELKRHD